MGCFWGGLERKTPKVHRILSCPFSACHPDLFWASMLPAGPFLWPRHPIGHLSPRADVLGVGCHTQAPLRSWLCCHGGIPVARVCDCEVFSLFNVVGYSRFSKSVFFPCDPLPVTCCPHPTPVKKRTSICKAVDTIREAFCNGF